MPKNPIAKNINKFNKPKVIPNKRAKKIARDLYKQMKWEEASLKRINKSLGTNYERYEDIPQ